MKRGIFAVIVLLACAVFLKIESAQADGALFIERPGWGTPWITSGRQVYYDSQQGIEGLPVKYHRVKVKIDNGVAITSVDQVFKNEYDVDVEGVYIFPLPEDAAITDFSVYVDGKKISGEILDKEAARRAYEDMVRKMKDPALLEYVGRNMFRARVSGIPKHSEKRIELSYQQIINYDQGMYTYIYPLDTERFSPKPLEEVVVSTAITSALPIKSVYSPSHKVDTVIKEKEAVSTYEERNVTPNKNFILHYSVSEKDIGMNVLCYRRNNEEGYFMMLVSPGQLEGRTIDKDIVFVLDTSGSMNGEKIAQAKDALKFCINNLHKGDRFNIISFATSISNYNNGLLGANSDNTQKASGFIDRFQATGGTNINEAILAALKMFDDLRRPRMIVFLTDGEATEGVTEIKEIIKNVSSANTHGVRIFVFGVGKEVNTHLLDKMSEVNRGASEYILPQENIEAKISSFYRKVSEPVISDITIDFGGISTIEVYPQTLPDIFKGSQLILLGRYKNSGAATITLSGYVNEKKKTFTYSSNFPKYEDKNDFIPRLWAMRKIGYLMSEIRFTKENKKMIEEVEKISKDYGVITPYTSFFIPEQDAVFANNASFGAAYSSKGGTVWGVSESLSLGLGGMYNGAYESRDSYSRGLDKGMAIDHAIHVAKLKGSEQALGFGADTVRHIGSKTFHLREDGYWVDAEFKEGTKFKEIKYLSSDYLALLKNKPLLDPLLGRYLALGKNMILVLGGQAYKISE